MAMLKRTGSPIPTVTNSTQLAMVPCPVHPMPEEQALEELAGHGVIRAGLRKYAAREGHGGRREGDWLYSGSKIEDLRENWLTKKDAAKDLGFSDSQLFHWWKEKGYERVVIGKVSLVRTKDVLAGIRERLRGTG